MVSVYSYQNYRKYLADYYRWRKSDGGGFTYARFSEQAGLRSPNYLKLVMDGKKNLTDENIARFARGLRLGDHEVEYFEMLVRLGQAKTAWEREYHRGRIRKLRERISLEQVAEDRVGDKTEAETLSSWAHHAILLLTGVRGFRESPRWIRRRLFGKVSEDEVRSALQRLLDLRLLVRGRAGKLARSHLKLEARPELSKISSRIYSESILERAGKELRLGEREERVLSTNLVGISAEQLPELKRRAKEFIRSVQDWAKENPAPDQVYALAFCGFPLSDKPEHDESDGA